MVTPNNYVGTIIIVNCLHMYVAAQQQNNNIITYDNDHIFFCISTNGYYVITLLQ